MSHQYMIKIGTRSKNAKLNCEQVKEVFKLRESGMMHKEIKAETGISLSTISKILNRTSYTDCKGWRA